MELRDFLVPDALLADLRATSKKQLLQDLARQAATLAELPERLVFDTLVEREKLGSTGIGGGVAIPHGKLEEIDRLYGIFARLAAPVPFDAPDEHPIDLVFLLLAPESAGADHLKALARIQRLLRDPALCKALRAAPDERALHALLAGKASPRAA